MTYLPSAETANSPNDRTWLRKKIVQGSGKRAVANGIGAQRIPGLEDHEGVNDHRHCSQNDVWTDVPSVSKPPPYGEKEGRDQHCDRPMQHLQLRDSTPAECDVPAARAVLLNATRKGGMSAYIIAN
jgi:hypothetical protein